MLRGLLRGALQLARKWICLALTIVLLAGLVGPAMAVGGAGVPLKEKFGPLDDGSKANTVYKAPDYFFVLQEYEQNGIQPYSGEAVDIALGSGITDAGSVPGLVPLAGREDVLIWSVNMPYIEWTVTVPETALYHLLVDYRVLGSNYQNAQRTLLVNGELPYFEATNLYFYRFWEDKGEPKVNVQGDQIRPGQVEVAKWTESAVFDNAGRYAEPLCLSLQAGENTIRLNYTDQEMAIARMALTAPQTVPTYAEVSASFSSLPYATQPVEFQAETEVLWKNDSTLRREADGDYKTVPYAGGRRLLNVIGANKRWKKGGQAITWEFAAPQTGLYKLNMRAAQYWGDGLPMYRKVEIDDKVPYAELLSYAFHGEDDWRMETLSVDGQDMLFYLEEGVHTITMTAVYGDITEVLLGLTGVVFDISAMTRDIILQTGVTPDPNYDYQIDRRIPNFEGRMSSLSERLGYYADLLTDISKKRPLMANNLLTTKALVDGMIKDPDTVARNLDNFTSSQTTLGDWMVELQNSYLELDYFQFLPPETKVPKGNSNIFQKLWMQILAFFASFTQEYDQIIETNEDVVAVDEAIDVWVAMGIEWGEILKEMVDDDFMPSTGIGVNINLLPVGQLATGGVNALMLAITSGQAPDVAIGVGSGSPVELAIRSAVVDLSQFEGIDEVKDRFLPEILMPYYYRGGFYALPQTMSFTVMLYRKDIFVDELGLTPPETWDDLYNRVLPVLSQNGMQFYYPRNYVNMLMQKGGSYYTEDNKRSALDQRVAFDAFDETTALYTQWGVPLSADFYNRFRSGEMPIGVTDYASYMRLLTAAPELYGRWGVALIPGTMMEDGTVNHTVGTSLQLTETTPPNTSCMILSQTEKPEASWEFLKWWTSDSVQTGYGDSLESVIGVGARWNSANITAFKTLPWREEDLPIIEEQMAWVREMPVVLGGYFTTRHLNNAFTRTLMNGMRPRDSLEQAVKDINKELISKQAEYPEEP